MNKIKASLLLTPTLLLVFSFLGFGYASANTNTEDEPVNANNAIQSGLCGGSGLKLESGSCSSAALGNPQGAINSLIARMVNIFSVIVGIVAVIMIIYGGFRYIISGGDSSNVSDAKNTILYAIIGLVVVALSQFLVRFVLGQTTGFNGN